MPHQLLLINPWIYDFTAFDLWSKPLGLLYLASFLRNSGYKIDFIDCMDKHYPGAKPNIKKYGTGSYNRTVIDKPQIYSDIKRKYARYGIPEDYFIEQLIKSKPEAVLVTSIMTYWYPGVRHVVNLVRKYCPNVPVILGGIYASLLPEHARKTIKPDYIVTGPGEIKVVNLLNEIFGDSSNHKVPQSIDNYPYPAFDLIPENDYMVIMTARGCPYDCSFCAQKQIAMRFTQRDPDQVVLEFSEQYRRYRTRDFAFYDDALFINKNKHIKVILQKLAQSRLPLRLHSPNGLFARELDAELAELMYRTNFKTIRLSFETSNESRRKDMYSKVSNEDMVRAVENLVRAGYKPAEIEAYVLMGLPGQSLEEVIASMLFVNNLGVQIKLASFSPIPGTLDFQRAVDMNQIQPDIDPLLTNKSIFPLKNAQQNYDSFVQLRQFSHILNQSAQKNILPFSNSTLGQTIKSIVREMN